MNPITALARATARPVGAKSSTEPPLIVRSVSAGRSSEATWDEAEAVRRGYRGNVWVSTAVRLIATAAARVPLVAQVLVGEEWEPASEHPEGSAVRQLQDLLDRPNPKMDRSGFIRLASSRMSLTGNCLAKIVTAQQGLRGRPVALWPLALGYRAVPDETGWPIRYRHSGLQTVDRELPAEGVAHWMFQDPGRFDWGVGPLESLAGVVEADIEATLWNREAMKRRAVKDGMLIGKDGVYPTDIQYAQARQLVDEQMQGAENAHGVALIPGSWTYQDLSRSPVEMDFLATSKFTVDKVAAGFNLLPALLSPEAATYSNLEHAIRWLWESNVMPWLDLFCGTLNRQVVPRFGEEGRLWIVPDASAVEALQDKVGAKVETMERLLRAGTPYNEAIRLLDIDLAPIDGAGDMPHGVSLGRLAIESGSSPPELPEGATLATEEVAQTALNGAQVQSLQAIVQAVADRILPPETAIELISVSFPTVDRDTVLRMVGAASSFDRPTDVTPAKRLPPAAIIGKAAPPASERKASILAELAPLFALADRTASRIATVFRTAAASARSSVREERVRSALESGTPGDVARAAGIQALIAELDALVAPVVAASQQGAAVGAERLASAVGRDIEVDQGLLDAWSRGTAVAAAGFIAESSERAVLDAVADLRSTLSPADLAAAAGLFSWLVAINGPQAARARKFLADLLAAGQSIADAIHKVERMIVKQITERATMVGADQGSRAAFGAQRQAWDQARQTRQVQDIHRIWVDSDDGRVCPECISLDEQVARGDDLYVSPISGSSYFGPPEPHPGSCRCGEGVVEVVG